MGSWEGWVERLGSDESFFSWGRGLDFLWGIFYVLCNFAYRSGILKVGVMIRKGVLRLDSELRYY